MKGLLLKDFYNQKAIIKLMAVIYLLWVAVAVTNKNDYMLTAFTPIVAAVLTINAIALDYMVKFDGFALTMPVSRYELIFSKYLYNFIITIIGLIIGFLFSMFAGSQFVVNVLVCVASFSASLILAAISIPLVLKFGVEKSKIIIMIVCILPMALVPVLQIAFKSRPAMPMGFYTSLVWFSPVVALVLTFLSAQISEKIYLKKDF